MSDSLSPISMPLSGGPSRWRSPVLVPPVSEAWRAARGRPCEARCDTFEPISFADHLARSNRESHDRLGRIDPSDDTSSRPQERESTNPSAAAGNGHRGLSQPPVTELIVEAASRGGGTDRGAARAMEAYRAVPLVQAGRLVDTRV